MPRPGERPDVRRRRILSRQELLDAARAIVTERGYRGASVAAIAENAGISNGALYRHFPSKVDLFVELFRDVCEREMRAGQRAAQCVDDPLDQLDAIFENFARRALARPHLTWALIAEPVDPAIEEVRLEYRARYRRAIAQLLEQAIDQGSIPPQDTAIAAAALLGGGNEVFAGPLSPLADSAQQADAAITALRSMLRGAVRAFKPTPRGQ